MKHFIQFTYKTLKQLLTSAAILSLVLVSGKVTAAPVVFSMAGASAADIQGTVDDFRNFLGGLNPNVVGSFPDGRREINWDGVSDAVADPNSFPPNFFNDPVNGSPRGVVLFTPGTSLLVSANMENPTNAKIEFGDLNERFIEKFATFSPQRLFTAIDNTIVEILFFEPGTENGATVSGFGAVFTDVNRENSTKIEYLDKNGNLLFSQSVEPGPVEKESLSFLGVAFDAGEKVFLVRITSGNRPISGKGLIKDHQGKGHGKNQVEMDHPENNHEKDPWGNDHGKDDVGKDHFGGHHFKAKDFVVMDDFIFGEPQPTNSEANGNDDDVSDTEEREGGGES